MTPFFYDTAAARSISYLTSSSSNSWIQFLLIADSWLTEFQISCRSWVRVLIFSSQTQQLTISPICHIGNVTIHIRISPDSWRLQNHQHVLFSASISLLPHHTLTAWEGNLLQSPSTMTRSAEQNREAAINFKSQYEQALAWLEYSLPLQNWDWYTTLRSVRSLWSWVTTSVCSLCFFSMSRSMMSEPVFAGTEKDLTIITLWNNVNVISF